FTTSSGANVSGGTFGDFRQIKTTTSTTVTASQPTVTYGTPVTFTINVTAISGIVGIPAGSVEVFDNGSHDLGTATFFSAGGLTSTWTLKTGPRTLNVTSPTSHVITAVFSGS